MKNVFFLAILSVIIFSCNKEQTEFSEHANEQTNQETLNKIKSRTVTFIEAQKRAFPANQDRRLWGWVKGVVRADVIGGAKAAIKGKLAGKEDGELLGEVIIGGVSSSIEKALEKKGEFTVSTPDGTANNDDNPYELYGQGHVNLLYAGLGENITLVSTPEDDLDVDSYLNFSKTWVVDNGYCTALEVDALTVADVNTILDYLSLHGELSLAEYVDQLYLDGELTLEEKDVLSLYASAFEAAVTFDDFLIYSIGVEADVLAGGYSASTEELLLITMSTTRHDTDFWIKASE